MISILSRLLSVFGAAFAFYIAISLIAGEQPFYPIAIEGTKRFWLASVMLVLGWISVVVIAIDIIDRKQRP